MKILVATDAWGQTNGVVFAYQRIAAPVEEFGAELAFVTPEGFPSLPLPTYPGIRLALASAEEVGRRIDRAAPTHVHIATEGPDRLGRAPLLPEARPHLHDELSHALSRICRRPPAGAAVVELQFPAPLPRARRTDAGADVRR